MEDDQRRMRERISLLKADIESMEEVLAGQEVDDNACNEEDITRHLLTESAGMLSSIIGDGDPENTGEPGSDAQDEDVEQATLEKQIEALAGLSGIRFTKVETGLIVERGTTVRRIRLAGTSSGLAFELVIDVQEVDAGEAPQVTRCDLSVPHEVEAELAGFVRSVSQERVLTVALQGLSKFAHASQQRQQLFEGLQRSYPRWICLPHGTLATPLLSVRPPPGTFADLVFDFLWQMEVSPTGALEHCAALVPHATQECDSSHTS